MQPMIDHTMMTDDRPTAAAENKDHCGSGTCLQKMMIDPILAAGIARQDMSVLCAASVFYNFI